MREPVVPIVDVFEHRKYVINRVRQRLRAMEHIRHDEGPGRLQNSSVHVPLDEVLFEFRHCAARDVQDVEKG